jgi:hypothetical protein
MTDACDHDGHTPHQSGSLGIPQVGQFDPAAFERAVNAMLVACGVAPDSVHTGRTAQRVRELWQKRLLGGYAMHPADALGEGFADDRDDMVWCAESPCMASVRIIWCRFAGSRTSPIFPVGGCTASAASRAWSMPSAIALPIRNG